MDIANISGVGEFTVKTEKNDDKERKIYFAGEKAFLIENKNRRALSIVTRKIGIR